MSAPDLRAFPRPARSGRGALARAGLVVLCVLSGMPSPPARAEEEPPLPPHTTPYGGLPPWLLDGAPSRAAWCEAMARAGRARAGTRTGGDLLFAAAHAARADAALARTALALYEEAVAAYPADDPTRGVVLVHHAAREALRGGVERAEALLARAEGWLGQEPPADLSEADETRWQALAALWGEDLRLRADLHESNGRFAEAAEALEARARRTADGALAASLLERAAVLRHRAGDADGARRAAQEAVVAAPTDAARARHALWNLYQRHGLLAPDGALGLWSTWPGEDFEREAIEALRHVQGSAEAGPLYLAVASGALTAGRRETALEIYRLALRDNVFVESARGRPPLWRGLLVAFSVALETGALDDAERILDDVARIAGEPIAEMGDYRIALREAREEARAVGASPAPTPGTHTSERPEPRTPLGRLETGERSADEGEEDGAPTPDAGEGEGGGSNPLVLASLGLLGLAAFACWRRRRSRGKEA